MARPTKYNPKILPDVKRYAEAGLTDEQLACVLSVSRATISTWKELHPEFLDTLKEGKSTPDGNVVRSLYERAIGYEHEEDKIFCNALGEVTTVKTIKHYPPDTTACIYWTKNRMPEDWRDKQDHDMNLKNWPEEITVKIVNGNDS